MPPKKLPSVEWMDSRASHLEELAITAEKFGKSGEQHIVDGHRNLAICLRALISAIPLVRNSSTSIEMLLMSHVCECHGRNPACGDRELASVRVKDNDAWLEQVPEE